MHISPPLTILAILALTLTAVAWWAPPPPRVTHVTVDLSPAVYDDLVQQVKGRIGDDGRALTLAEAIADLTMRSVNASDARLASPPAPVQ